MGIPESSQYYELLIPECLQSCKWPWVLMYRWSLLPACWVTLADKVHLMVKLKADVQNRTHQILRTEPSGDLGMRTYLWRVVKQTFRSSCKADSRKSAHCINTLSSG